MKGRSHTKLNMAANPHPMVFEDRKERTRVLKKENMTQWSAERYENNDKIEECGLLECLEIIANHMLCNPQVTHM